MRFFFYFSTRQLHITIVFLATLTLVLKLYSISLYSPVFYRPKQKKVHNSQLYILIPTLLQTGFRLRVRICAVLWLTELAYIWVSIPMTRHVSLTLPDILFAHFRAGVEINLGECINGSASTMWEWQPKFVHAKANWDSRSHKIV